MKTPAPCSLPPAPAQLPLPGDWASALSLVDRFEARLRDLRMIGLTLWTLALRHSVQRLFATEQRRRAAAYEQLMLLEHDVQSVPADLAKVLARIGTAKGLLAAIVMGWLLYAFVGGDVSAARGLRARGRRDEVALVEEI